MTSDHRSSRPARTPYPARGPAAPGTGARWRRQVRWVTAGVAGAAGIGALALTVGLAQAAAPAAGADLSDDPAADPAPSTAAPGPTSGAPLTRPDTAPRTTAPGTQAPAAPSTAPPAITAPPTLAPPVQTPSAGSGRSHARSGGS